MDVEEALIGPVAGGYEEDQEEDGAVDAWSIEEVGEKKERYHEPSHVSVLSVSFSKDVHSQRRRIGGYEKER